jgi:CHASE3 domain sensor protein
MSNVGWNPSGIPSNRPEGAAPADQTQGPSPVRNAGADRVDRSDAAARDDAARLGVPPVPRVERTPDSEAETQAFMAQYSRLMDGIVGGRAGRTGNAEGAEAEAKRVLELLGQDPATAAERLGDPAFRGAIEKAAGKMYGEDGLQGSHEVTADNALFEFLKLNINDPTNDVKTQNDLADLLSSVKQGRLKDALDQMNKSLREAEEAQKKQEDANFWGILAIIVAVIVTIVLTVLNIFCFGSLTALEVAAICAMGAMISGAFAVAAAYKQDDATDAALDSAESQNTAKMYEHLAQMLQEMIEEVNGIVQMILESKNKTVEAALKMSEQGHASRMKLMSATASSG